MLYSFFTWDINVIKKLNDIKQISTYDYLIYIFRIWDFNYFFLFFFAGKPSTQNFSPEKPVNSVCIEAAHSFQIIAELVQKTKI